MLLNHARKTGVSFAPLLLALLVSSCGGGSGDEEPSNEGIDSVGTVSEDSDSIADIDITVALAEEPAPRSCEVEDLNRWVYESMLDYYLFYDQVDRNLNASASVAPEDLITQLRVQPNDRFSYFTDQTSYEAFFGEGETFGYGWNFGRDENNNLLFSLIDPNSPLAAAGVTRGETLLAINEFDIPSFANLTFDQQDEILGVGDEVRTLELTIGDLDDQQRQVSVTKATYLLQTVLDAKVLQNNDSDVGYLSFYQFLEISSNELADAFSIFNAADVDELVIDMRFNTGGRISVANELASYVLGEGNETDVFTTYALNDKYEDFNFSLLFQDLPNALSLNRVFVLQSENTCSASELVINSLRPYVEVITVGSTTCGKPYATSPNIACGKVINALQVELVNANGVGDYFDGLGADCPVSENLREPLGVESEPLLSTALDYMSVGSCDLLASRSVRNKQRLTREWLPEWRGGNTF